jgi:hypothetical protein
MVERPHRRSVGTTPRPWPRVWAGPLALGLALAVLLSACGGDEEPELTFEDRLTLLEGRTLTPAEVADRAAIGEALCRLDEKVLEHVWLRLDDDELDFQDLVVSMLCPDRAVEYAGYTGRYVTDEAEQSGVVTSTTRPTTTVRSTSRPGGGASTTSTSGQDGDEGDSTGDPNGADGTDDTTDSGGSGPGSATTTTSTSASATSTLVTTPLATSGTPST